MLAVVLRPGNAGSNTVATNKTCTDGPKNSPTSVQQLAPVVDLHAGRQTRTLAVVDNDRHGNDDEGVGPDVAVDGVVVGHPGQRWRDTPRREVLPAWVTDRPTRSAAASRALRYCAHVGAF